MSCETNVKLSRYTTFKIGGIADCFFVAKNKKDLINILQWAQKGNLPFFVLGGGSNILIPDEGIRGLVIKIEFEEMEIVKNKMSVQAGCQLSKAVNAAYQNSSAGLEWAIGIPGTIGGAIVGNAGAYGSSMADSVLEAEVLDLSGGELKVEKFTKEDCQFAYRGSIFKNKQYIVLSAVLQLREESQGKIKKAMDLYLRQRTEKIPAGNSAGCIFKNIEIDKIFPLWKRGAESVIARKVLLTRQSKSFEIPKEFLKYNKLPAARVVEQCGLKGAVCGRAEISDKHANFIINRGDAKCEDVIRLMELVEEKVQEKFGIKLEREVQAWYNAKKE